jgi:ORF6N domain
MAETNEESDDDAVLPAVLPRVLVIRGEPVMLAADVARAFEVETREVTQAIRRNPQKFTSKHWFQPSEAELERLRSQGVISSRKGWAPTVLTQKGVVRLATVLTAPKALEATDQIIDLFLGIYAQLQAGASEVRIDSPGALVPAGEDAAEVRSLRRKIVEGLGALLKTTIDTKHNTTVGDELGQAATDMLGHLKALLKSQQLKNEQLAAETARILEQTRDMYERRQADLRKSDAETDRIVLENVKTRIEIVQQLLAMTDSLEPGALARVLPRFAATGVLLPAPERRKEGKD